jgi:hypothetical protein
MGEVFKELSMKGRFAEDVTSVNDEAELCLRKCEDAAWGETQDYPACIRSIAQSERMFQQQNPGGARLKVEAFFSNSDVMIGYRVQELFKQCWQQDVCKESLDFCDQDVF